MALTIDQQIAVRNRIEKALQKAIDKRNQLTKNNQPDSVYRSEIENKILAYLNSIESLLNTQTLDYNTTLRDVNNDMQVWEEALDGL